MEELFGVVELPAFVIVREVVNELFGRSPYPGLASRIIHIQPESAVAQLAQ